MVLFVFFVIGIVTKIQIIGQNKVHLGKPLLVLILLYGADGDGGDDDNG